MPRVMGPAEWARVQPIFDDLVTLDPSTRAMRLKTLRLDKGLKAELASLLEASDQAGPLDARVSAQAAREAEPYTSLKPGDQVGPFEIKRLIGRGGAGEVYLAVRRDADFDQKAAIKLLRPEAVDRMGLFDAERRMLATLQHPGIARLIDGGLAPDGRAYMAMEFVEGQDISRWCQTEALDLEVRLALFDQVCDAVAYAHRRLVVHRDIKPSNILIDGEGRARLLDFGVARLIETTSDARTATVAMLTPEYAAPEQLENRPPTTAADVYGLGAVLFELLTGRGAWGFDGASMPVVLRRLLHDDPPAPSKAAAAWVASPIAATRLKGDLDAIVLKAMRRNPGERYESVSALADDIRRHREHRPVRARGRAALYLAQRFARRNRWTVTAAAAAVLALAAGAGGFAWQARATAVERDIARAEAARAEAVNQSISLMFRNAGESGRGGSATAKELLARSTTQLLAHINPADSAQTEVILSLAELYTVIDDLAGAETLLEQGLAKGAGRGDPIATARMRLLLAQAKAGVGDHAEARRLLSLAEAAWAADPDRYRAEVQEAVGAEAYILRMTGDRDGGIRLLIDSLDDADRAFAADGRSLVTRYANLSLHLLEANRIDEAERIVTRGEAAMRRTGAERTAPGLTLMTARGALQNRRGDRAGAERTFRRAAALRRELYGPSVLLGMDLLNLSRLVMTHDPQEALTMLNEAQTLTTENLGSTALPTVLVGLARIDALCRLGEPDRAELILAEVSSVLQTAGPRSLPAGLYYRGLGFIRLEQGRTAEARAALNQAAGVFAAAGAAGKPHIKDVRTLQARL